MCNALREDKPIPFDFIMHSHPLHTFNIGQLLQLHNEINYV